jgi:hypothetical protein
MTRLAVLERGTLRKGCRKMPSHIKHKVHPSNIIAPKGIWTRDADYREAVEKRQLVEGWVMWVADFHFDFFLTFTFRKPVHDDFAHSALTQFITSLSPTASAFIGWGGATPQSCHALLSLSQFWGIKKPRTGLNFRALTARHLKRSWPWGEDNEAELFDCSQRVGCVRYIVDHHEVDFVRTPSFHRGNRWAHKRE